MFGRKRMQELEHRLSILNNLVGEHYEALTRRGEGTTIAVDYGADPDLTTGIIAQRVGDSLRIVATFRVVRDTIDLQLQGQVMSTIDVSEIMAEVRRAIGVRS